MSREIELIENFLIERTAFSRAIPKEKFARLFPKSTDEHLISRIYFYLNKTINSKSDEITKNIDQFDLTLRALKSEKDATDNRSNIEEINAKLEALSSILDAELVKEEEKFVNNKRKLKALDNELSDALQLTEVLPLQDVLTALDEFHALIR